MDTETQVQVEPKVVIEHGQFTVSRTYPVPPARVFFAFSDKEMKRRWLIEGEGWEVFEFTSDFRVGGADVSRFRFQDGPEIRNDTQFQDIVPDRRIAFTYRMAIGAKVLSASLVTVEFDVASGGTKMTYTEQGAYFDGTDSAKGREEGTIYLMGRLGELLLATN